MIDEVVRGAPADDSSADPSRLPFPSAARPLGDGAPAAGRRWSGGAGRSGDGRSSKPEAAGAYRDRGFIGLLRIGTFAVRITSLNMPRGMEIAPMAPLPHSEPLWPVQQVWS